MIWNRRHLGETQLIDAWLAGERDSRVNAHLAACEPCTRRLRELAGAMSGLRAAVTSEADRAFTPARLAAQRQQILHRLEQTGRLARVIPFRAFPALRAFPSLRSFPSGARRWGQTGAGRGAPRWIAAAAIAGLVAGLTMGRLIPGAPLSGILVDRDAARVAGLPGLQGISAESRGTPGQAASPLHLIGPVSEEEFLSQVEMALGTPRVAELEALDALTPPVVEIAARLR